MEPLDEDSIRKLPLGEPLVILSRTGAIIIGSNIEPAAIAAENGDTVIRIKDHPMYNGKPLSHGRDEAWGASAYLAVALQQYQKGNPNYTVTFGVYDTSRSGQLFAITMMPKEIAYFAPIITRMPDYFIVFNQNFDKVNPFDLGITPENWIDVLNDPTKGCFDILIFPNEYRWKRFLGIN